MTRPLLASVLSLILAACGAKPASRAAGDAGTSNGSDGGMYVTCDPLQNGSCRHNQEICTLELQCVTPQYTDNGDGTVSDDVTGLVWQQLVPTNPCPEEADAGGILGTCESTDAQAYCASLNLAGTGWRVPSLPELFSIVQIQTTPPMIDQTVFPGTPSAAFWSSTSASVGLGGVPSVVDFANGSEQSAFPMFIRSAARCVR